MYPANKYIQCHRFDSYSTQNPDGLFCSPYFRERKHRYLLKPVQRTLLSTTCTYIRHTVKKQEAGVKLKMQDLKLFNLVFESSLGWILDFSNRSMSAFFTKNWTLILIMNVNRSD